MNTTTENNIKLPEEIGTCINCGSPAVRQQPYFSKHPIVNDGWYLYKCTNEDCHNYTGMELRNDELYLLDFVDRNKGLFSILKRAKIIYLNNFKRKGGRIND